MLVPLRVTNFVHLSPSVGHIESKELDVCKRGGYLSDSEKVEMSGRRERTHRVQALCVNGSASTLHDILVSVSPASIENVSLLIHSSCVWLFFFLFFFNGRR